MCVPAGGDLSLVVADRFVPRLFGLAGLSRIPPRFGLLIPRCRAVHTFGMRFPIDVVFVRAIDEIVVVAALESVPPRALVREARADAVIEVAAREARRVGLRQGAVLLAREASRGAFQPHGAPHALGQVPVPVSEQLHRRGHEQDAHDRDVEQDRAREPGAELL
jgi:uncharacterized protein